MDTTDTLTCKICANEAPLAELVRERALGEGVYDVGLSCAVCDHWTHSCYTNPQLRQELTLVQYLVAQYQQRKVTENKMQQARERYKRNFEQFQQTHANRNKSDD